MRKDLPGEQLTHPWIVSLHCPVAVEHALHSADATIRMSLL